MKTRSNRLISILLSLMAALMCISAPAANALGETVHKASKMTLEVENVSGNAGKDVRVEIKVKNSVALKSLSGLGLNFEGNITPKSVESDVASTVDYSISGSKVSLELSGIRTAGNGSTLFTVVCHINDGCPVGYNKVSWANSGRLGAI